MMLRHWLTRHESDRSRDAYEMKALLEQKNWLESIVADAKQHAARLRDQSSEKLVAHSHLLRQLRCRRNHRDPKVLALAGAGAIEAVRRVLGLELFDVQLRAGLIIACGAVAEMQTGEGKTLSGVLPAYLHALAGRGVHVATTNQYLAQRDHDELSPVFEALGLTTGLLTEKATVEQAKRAYEADVTFAPGNTFGFDFLRDQMLLAESESRMLGATIYDRVRGTRIADRLRQRPLYAAIVDEIDHVLLDDATSPLILSGSGQAAAPDSDIHLAARELARDLTAVVDYQVDSATRRIRLTDEGFERTYENSAMATAAALARPWHEYVVLALRAKHCFRRDIDYIVRDQDVQIVDASTGRIFADRTWSDGLHQAVLALEKLPIVEENSALSKITRQRFFRHYEVLSGMTGTATGCEDEFASVYGLTVGIVPLRVASKRNLHDDHLSVDQDEKFQSVCDEAIRMTQLGRSVLIGTLNIAQSHAIAEKLEAAGKRFHLLNGIQDADEAAVVARAGQPSAITVATNLAGRGTDIKLHSDVRRAGGLHVIAVEHHSLSRVDRQLIGRSARCGDPGSARFFLAADDELFRHAPWISRAIIRQTQQPQKVFSLQKLVQGAQAEQESRAGALRWQMLLRDKETEDLLGRSSQPQKCLQL